MKYNLECEPFRGNEGGDESRGWPMIASVKQKKAMTTLPQTKSMLVFLGAKETRRQAGKIAYRHDCKTKGPISGLMQNGRTI